MREYLVTNPKQLGQTLKGVRRELKLTQLEVGQKIGFHQKEISKLESGAGKARVDRLFQLLSALEMEIVLRPRSAGSQVEEAW